MAVTCRTAREWLSAYYDNELTPPQQAEMEAHLAECTDCRRELADLRQAMRLLHEMPAPEIDPALSALFAQRVVERAARRPRFLPVGWWPRAAWACALLVLLAGGIWYAGYRPTGISGPVAGVPGNRPKVVTPSPGGAPELPTGSIAGQPERGQHVTTASAGSMPAPRHAHRGLRHAVVARRHLRPVPVATPVPVPVEEPVVLDPADTLVAVMMEAAPAAPDTMAITDVGEAAEGAPVLNLALSHIVAPAMVNEGEWNTAVPVMPVYSTDTVVCAAWAETE